MSKRKPLLGLIGIILLISVIAAWKLDRYRKVPFDRAINPVYWVRHIRGLDCYSPDTALLEHGNPNYREVALTIDDGPDPRYGPQIAAYLRARSVAATFFVVGIRVKQYPDIIRTIDKDGFEIGNHTYDHQRLDKLKPHEIANEIRLCAKHISAITGKEPTLLRPPGVQYNDQVLRTAKALGYVTVSWTCGAHDYDSQAPEAIAQRVVDRTEPGSIIILHQDTPSTILALPIIINRLQSRGYHFVTISQMLGHLNVHSP